MTSRWKSVLGLVICLSLAGVVAVGLARRTAAPNAGADEEEEEGTRAMGPGGPVPVQAAPVVRGTLTQTVRLFGVIRALPNQEARVAAQLGGRLTEVRVKRGDRVRAGQVVATVFSTDLRAAAQQAAAAREAAALRERAAAAQATLQREQQAAALREAEANLEAAQARLDELRAGPRAQDIAAAKADLAAQQAELDRLLRGRRSEEIAQAEAALQADKAELAKLKAGPRPQEIAQAEAAVRDARAHLKAAQHARDRAHTLFADGLASRKDQEQADADLTAAQTHLDQAQERLKLLREGTRREDVQAQEAKVRQSEAALALLQAGYRKEDIAAQRARVEAARQRAARLEAGARSQEIRAAEAAVAEAEAKLAAVRAGKWQVQATVLASQAAGGDAARAEADEEAARAQLSKTIITAPVTGVVTEVFHNRGEVVEAGTPLLEITNPKALRIVARLPAAHQSAVQVGTPATVSLPHAPGKSFATSVAIVGAEADAETGMLPVELPVPARVSGVREGMVAEVRLSLPSRPRSLVIPTTAVFARAGENYVYLIDKEHKVHERLVDLGVEQGGRVEALRGLAEGERVAVVGAPSLADGTTVEVVSQ